MEKKRKRKGKSSKRGREVEEGNRGLVLRERRGKRRGGGGGIG